MSKTTATAAAAAGFGDADISELITVKKCGIRFKPPALIAYYFQPVREMVGREPTARPKLRERVMPLRNFDATSDVHDAVSTLHERHRKVLGDGRVSIVQLERLARVVQLKMEGLDLEASLDKAGREYSVDPEEDLNKVDDEVLRRKKDAMDETFRVSRKKPGDPDFRYDVEVDFNCENSGQAIESSGWDSDNNNDSDF